MGCDGGTIPTRDELVKTRKKPEQKDIESVRLCKWQHCHLTQQSLARPIVACELGFLYSKEAIIQKLLDSKANQDSNGRKSDNARHIKSLKDVKELVLADNPSFDSKKPNASVGDGGYVDRFTSPYVCPISGLEMNGKFKFVFDWTNGKVLSDRGHKIVQRSDKEMKIPEENLITINPEEDDEMALMETKMEARKAREKVDKEAKKAAKRKHKLGTTNSPADEEGGKNRGKAVSKNGEMNKRNKLGSVQCDPTKSEVYKSLFSSHSSAANKPKGHWVTFDPRYN